MISHWKVLATFKNIQLLWLANPEVGPFQGRAFKIGRLAIVRWACQGR
jgi:hypothetical protein